MDEQQDQTIAYSDNQVRNITDANLAHALYFINCLIVCLRVLRVPDTEAVEAMEKLEQLGKRLEGR